MPVLIEVFIPRERIHRVVVDDVVAVLIHPVAVLVGSGEHRGVGVVAVVARGHMVCRCRAGKRGLIASVPVSIGIGVPGAWIDRAVVDDVVAVLVHAIAVLVGAGEHRGVGVVAVELLHHTVAVGIDRLDLVVASCAGVASPGLSTRVELQLAGKE